MMLSSLMQDLPLERLSDGDSEVLALATDSRAIAPGSLFFAREGWFVDSHKFIESAIKAGASAVVVTKRAAAPLAGDTPVFLSTQEDRDLGLVCDRFFEEPTRGLKVFGVTGTNGKTSVSYMLEHILREMGERPAVIGTVTHRFEEREIPARNTTPDGLTIHGFARESMDAGATALIIEVSSHGAVLERVAGVAFDSVGFTNLTADHLDFHKTFDAYLDAKRLLFTKFLDASESRGKQVNATVFADDPAADSMLVGVSGNATISRVGFDKGERRVEVLETLGAAGQRVRFDGSEVVLPVVGEHNVANAVLAASMCADTIGGLAGDALAALRGFRGIPGRFELAYSYRDGEPPTFVDYAHSPDAVARALPVLHALGAGPTTCVLGCGGDRDVAKRPMMGGAAFEGADRAIFTADNPRSEDPNVIIDQMLEGVSEQERVRVQRTADRSEAIERAVHSSEGPTLIAGKGHETYQEVGGVRFHFDDREEVRRAVRARRADARLADTPLLAGWSATRIARACGGRVVQRGDVDVWGALTTDSRAVEADSIFVALRGDRFDGHDFVGDVVDKGAGLLLVSEPVAVPSTASVVRVDDTGEALQSLASALIAEGRARRGGLQVVGITGSNGKTTTKELLAALLGDQTLATRGNFNNHIGLPLTVAGLTARHRVAVLEMGANQPNDIFELAEIASPDVAVVTSIGAAHLEGFGDLDGVRRAKAGIGSTGAAPMIIPASEFGHAAWAGAEITWTFGASDDATIRVRRPDAFGEVHFAGTGEFAGTEFSVPLALAGAHNAANLAAAMLAFAALRGQLPTREHVAETVGALELPGGRLSSSTVSRRTIIDDAYNANPASMLASLSILASASAPRVAVLGEMLELGSDHDAGHRAVGEAAARSADVVVTVGKGARGIAEAAATPLAFEDVDAASEWLVANVPAGATLLLKASRGARLERLVPMLTAEWEGRN